MRNNLGDLKNIRSIERRVDGEEVHKIILKGTEEQAVIPASEENADMLTWAARKMRRDEEDDDA